MVSNGLGTVRVRLFMNWRGHRYNEVVDMPDDSHTYAWLGLGLCEFADDDPWVEPAPVADPVADVRWDADASRFVPLPIGNPEIAQGGVVESVVGPGDSGREQVTVSGWLPVDALPVDGSDGIEDLFRASLAHPVGDEDVQTVACCGGSDVTSRDLPRLLGEPDAVLYRVRVLVGTLGFRAGTVVWLTGSGVQSRLNAGTFVLVPQIKFRLTWQTAAAYRQDHERTSQIVVAPKRNDRLHWLGGRVTDLQRENDLLRRERDLAIKSQQIGDAELLRAALNRLLVKAEAQFGAPMVNDLTPEELAALDRSLTPP